MQLFFWIAFLVPALTFATERVRHIECRLDQIVTVRTAIGIATIIQVPDRPSSVVVGDQEKFKVEYLDQAITIKPLHAGAKSNLYIYTDYRRYNVQLVTGPEVASDYVVYLENLKQKETLKQKPMHWSPFVRSMTNEEIIFDTKKLGQSGGSLLIEFQISTLRKLEIKPEWIWLTQDKMVRPIQYLFMSSLGLDTGEKSQGVLQVLSKDIDPTKPLRIELRRKKITYLILPKVNLWK